jgi:hypothetical protein
MGFEAIICAIQNDVRLFPTIQPNGARFDTQPSGV